jgi:hypothetical protein
MICNYLSFSPAAFFALHFDQVPAKLTTNFTQIRRRAVLLNFLLQPLTDLFLARLIALVHGDLLAHKSGLSVLSIRPLNMGAVAKNQMARR